MTDYGLAMPSNSRCSNLLYPAHPKIVLTEAPEITVLEEQYTIRHVFVLYRHNYLTATGKITTGLYSHCHCQSYTYTICSPI